MKVLKALPLFGFLWILYNALLLAGTVPGALGQELLAIALVSGARWALSLGDLLLLLGLLALFVETFKSTRTSVVSIVDHILSTMVFVAFLIEFIVVAGAGNSVFLMLAAMALLDVIGGFTITIVAARRDIGVGEDLTR